MGLLRCGLVAMVLVGAACGGGVVVPRPDASGVSGIGGRGGAGGTGGTGGVFSTKTYLQSLNRDVDILFLIDDSSSMVLAQRKLLADFPTLMTTLRNLPGGLPNVHIGVVSSDMGAGDGSVAGCNASGGNQGIFQYTARSTCTTTNLASGATYISDSDGVKNYTGALEDVFKCIAALGESGCGFEHQLGAIQRALGADGRAAPAENQGFLRADAYLAIVMLTNEDDCSATPGVPLFDTSANRNIASQLGPPSNFRCNEFGHICAGMHPIRMAPNNDVTSSVAYTDCQSNDSEGYLLGVADTANRLKSLKTDPAQLFVASIQGAATPYVVTWKAPSTTDTSCGAASCPWPVVAHACTASDTSFADPGVRTAEFVNQFGANGLVLPICSDSFAPSLQRIGDAIGQLFAPLCIPDLADDPAQPGLQPKCAVTGQVRQTNGTLIDRALQPCAATGYVGPCWTVTTAQPGCNGKAAFGLNPDPAEPNAIGSLKINCVPCTSGSADAGTCL